MDGITFVVVELRDKVERIKADPNYDLLTDDAKLAIGDVASVVENVLQPSVSTLTERVRWPGKQRKPRMIGGRLCGHQHPAFCDLTGFRADNSKLVVIEDPGNQGHNPKVKVRCDCGTEKWSFKNGIKTGRVRSCGCTKWPRNKIHGATGTKIYRSWCVAKRNGQLVKEWLDFQVMLLFFNGETNISVRRPDRTKLLGPDNYATTSRLYRTYVTVDGVDWSIMAASKLLVVSKQRAHQIYKLGCLAARIRQATQA